MLFIVENSTLENIELFFAVVKTLREIKWYRIQQTFTAPNLLSYFSSSAWKDIVKILEHDIKCTVDCDTVSAIDGNF